VKQKKQSGYALRKHKGRRGSKNSAPLILILSSQVAYGHVGASAAAPSLQALGFETLVLPSVLYSNHPGHGRFTGQLIGATQMGRLYDGIKALGIVPRIGGILTGYLPRAAQVRLAAAIIDDVKSRTSALVCCDPVAGDETGGLYVPPSAAAATAKYLLERADILTPNKFELGYFSEQSIFSKKALLAAVERLAGKRAAGTVPKEIIVTSAFTQKTRIASLLIAPGVSDLTWTEKRNKPPHGLGDSLSAFYLGWRLKGFTPPEAFHRAQADIQLLLAHCTSGPHAELCFAGLASRLAAVSA
jgi:pyridoxine kinase